VKYRDEVPTNIKAIRADMGEILLSIESRVLPGKLADDDRRAVFLRRR
jgi:hypothetical protein